MSTVSRVSNAPSFFIESDRKGTFCFVAAKTDGTFSGFCGFERQHTPSLASKCRLENTSAIYATFTPKKEYQRVEASSTLVYFQLKPPTEIRRVQCKLTCENEIDSQLYIRVKTRCTLTELNKNEFAAYQRNERVTKAPTDPCAMVVHDYFCRHPLPDSTNFSATVWPKDDPNLHTFYSQRTDIDCDSYLAAQV